MPIERVSASTAAAAETAASAAADRAKAQANDAKRAEPAPEPSRNQAPDVTGAVVDTQG